MRRLVSGLAAVGAILVLAGSGSGGVAVGAKHDAQAAAKVNIPWSGLAVGVNDGDLTLGQFQSVIFAELDGPRKRAISIQVIGE